jgi:hypothetical protein
LSQAGQFGNHSQQPLNFLFQLAHVLLELPLRLLIVLERILQLLYFGSLKPQLYQLAAVQSQTLDMKPTAFRQADQSAIWERVNVHRYIVASRMKQHQVRTCPWRRPVIAFEGVARAAGIDQIFEHVLAALRLREEMVDL